jgi:hypothetical protein
MDQHDAYGTFRTSMQCEKVLSNQNGNKLRDHSPSEKPELTERALTNDGNEK